ncbi:MAG: peptidase M14, partial [Gemmatimonadetes bacterium]|nr:peptidase M14 [Gemmatimonadota bacterium]NNF13464.1 peptidase M14 [Gemmatimonadota bacterium]
VDDSHPLGWGLAPDAVTLFARSQVLERTDAGRAPGVSTPVCYAEADYLVSGWTLGGDEYLAGRTAVAQAAVDEGDVVLLAFDPIFRGQPRNTFKLFFNALMGSATGELPTAAVGLECR